MSSHVSEQQLTTLLDGQLNEGKEVDLCAHIDRCSLCQETLAELTSGQGTLVLRQDTATDVPEEDDLAFLERLKRCPPSEQDFLHAFLKAPRQPDALGQLGSYRIIKTLGQGGMGIVFHAEDMLLKRRVAVKVLKPQFVGDAAARQRFLREAQAASAIDHDHIVTIYQVGEAGGLPFLAMQYLQGESLRQRFRRDPPLELRDILRIGREIAEGLAAAHTEGLIHRDIKPSNIWLEGNRQRVKLLDFGLVKPASVEEHLTDTGAVVGTIGYLAPEQARGRNLDPRCDLFSLGCVLYEMTTGRLPFSGKDILVYVSALASHVPAPPHEVNPALPEAFSHLVMHLLEKNPEKRLASARAVVEAIQDLEQRISSADRSGNTAPMRAASESIQLGEPATSVLSDAVVEEPATPEERSTASKYLRRKTPLFALVLAIVLGPVLWWFGPAIFRQEGLKQAAPPAQDMQTAFVHAVGSLGDDVPQAITVDDEGFVYLTGAFHGEVDVDPGPGQKLLRSVGGSQDMFLAKFSPKGECLWAHAIGDKANNDEGRGLTVDGEGNVFVTGMFQGTVDFDPGQGQAELHGWGESECFVAKYSTEGKLLWAKAMGGPQYDSGSGIALDKAGNIVVAGSYRHEGDFDPGAGVFKLRSQGQNDLDVFVVKLDAKGNLVWAKTLGSNKNDVAHALALDAQGNVYLTGAFRYMADFDPGPGFFFINVAGQECNTFVAKLNGKGEFLWARSAASLFSGQGNHIAAGKKHVYVTGSFSGTCDFDPGEREFLLTCNGRHNCFLWKLDAEGNFVWAKAFDSTPTTSASGYGLAIDHAENCYLTGNFRGTLDFDPGAGQSVLQCKGDNDAFVAKLDRDGGFVWVKGFGSPLADVGNSIAVDRKGNIWATGEFHSTALLYPTAENRTLTSRGERDVFLWKLIPAKGGKK